MTGRPFCDALTVTFPEELWPEVRRAIVPELDAIGMAVECQRDRLALWRSACGFGVVRAEVTNAVRVLAVSGVVCGALRSVGRWGAFLAAVGQFPHRVTRLDATHDVPVDAPAVLVAAAAVARTGVLALTRKKVRPRDVTQLLSLREDGELSGTVYIGGRRSAARLCLYDKRKERMDTAMRDPGPLTRYELRLGAGVGVSLRDAHDPLALFWHFVPPEILSAPSDAPAWAPLESGYCVDRPAPLTPAERLYRRMQDSAELAALITLASEFPGGLEMLAGHVSRGGKKWEPDRGGGVSPPAAALA